MAPRKPTRPDVPSLFTVSPGDRGDVAQSSSAKGDIYRRTGFVEGIDRSRPPNMISFDAARLIKNMWFPKEISTLSTRPGLESILVPEAAGAITAIHVFNNLVDNKSYIVFTHVNSGGTDQEIKFVEIGDTTQDSLQDINGVDELVGSLEQPMFLTYNGKLILGTPGQAPRVWGGNLTAALPSYNFDAVTDVDEANNTIDIGTHVLAIYDQVMVAPVATGTLPTNLSANTRYFVQDVSGDLIKLSTAIGGTAIDIGDGTGTCRVYKIPAQARGKLTVSGTPVADETLVIGGSTWRFKTERANPFEITISADNTTQAANIVAAVNADSYEVTANNTSGVVYFIANQTGTIGNGYALSDTATGVTVDTGPNLVGGVVGQVLDFVDTYEAPNDSAVLLSDRNQRLVVAGPSSSRVFFSAPGNEFSFASGVYGYGEYWDLGTKEGNEITAVVPFGDELWAHKYGENKEIHRMRIADPNPATWSLTIKNFFDTMAAISSRAVVSAMEKHFVLDRKNIHVFYGTDTYDEMRRLADGKKISNLFTSATSSAFVVRDTENLVLYVFPTAGPMCFVYHYTSGRWTQWTFGHTSIHCGVYCEELGSMLFGGADGQIYQFNSRLAVDEGVDGDYPFVSSILGATLETEDLSEFVHKQTQIDLTNKLGGSGFFCFVHDRAEIVTGPLFTFDIATVGLTLAELHLLGTIAVAGDFPMTDVSAYAKVTDFTTDRGSNLAPYLEFTGAAEINQIFSRFAQQGRDYE